MDAPPPRPALRRPPHGAGRLPGAALVLGRVVADEGEVELTIDRLEDGEVSPYFHGVVVEGDQVEVRGLHVLLRWSGRGAGAARRRRLGSRAADVDAPPPPPHDAGLEMRLLYSVRTSEDVIYSDELGDDAVLTFTREPPDRWAGHTGGSTPR